MAKEIINNGSFDNDPSAEKIRESFDKCNNNFDELYLEYNKTRQSRTVNTRYLLSIIGVYYRTRSDAWGYNLQPITTSADFSSFSSASALGLQNCLMVASKDAILEKVFLDFSSIHSSVNSFKICFWAGMRIESTLQQTSITDARLLHEEIITKSLPGSVSASFEITPTPITIPKGYVINFLLSRLDGTEAETNLSITTTIKHI